MTSNNRHTVRGPHVVAHRSMCFQCLERRDLLAMVPFGATADDTAGYMLGDVLVTVVLLESDGTIDDDTENWQVPDIEEVKRNVVEGMKWWEDLLDDQETQNSLDFRFDFTYADEPIRTGYEPIGRPSDDFELWLDDFFIEVGLGSEGTYSDRIRAFNHSQRVAYETHWAFTIFVVNAERDPDSRFDTGGSLSQSFAFAGGRFFVTTSERPPSSYAHEAAHMFWAMDEYRGAKTYFDRRGYYDTQNVNAFDGNPNPESRVRSIMDSATIGYSLDAVSPSALEMIGWRDSDGNGVFDVLDVPHMLVGSGALNMKTGEYEFEGFAQVQTLKNLNRGRNGNDMTTNQIDRIEVRFDEASWQTVAEMGTYRADLELSIPVPRDAQRVYIRAVDAQSGVSSNVLTDELISSNNGWQNQVTRFDVNADTFITPLDALLVINQLNRSGSRQLDSSTIPPAFLDVNGDGYLSPLDALLVINELNTSVAGDTTPASRAAPVESSAEAESVLAGGRPRSPLWTDRGPERSGHSRMGLPYLPGREASSRTSIDAPRPAPMHMILDAFEPERPDKRTLSNRTQVVDLAMMELGRDSLDLLTSANIGLIHGGRLLSNR